MEDLRFTVEKRVKFGMVFGYFIFDNQLKVSTGLEYEDEYLAQSKCELKNLLNK
jgi:hypothetical protein